MQRREEEVEDRLWDLVTSRHCQPSHFGGPLGVEARAQGAGDWISNLSFAVEGRQRVHCLPRGSVENRNRLGWCPRAGVKWSQFSVWRGVCSQGQAVDRRVRLEMQARDQRIRGTSKKKQEG